jgi:hypothetical protein
MSPEDAVAWKLRIFLAGALFLLLGIILERRPLILASIVVLAIGVVLRLATRRPPPPRHASWDEPEE